MQSMQLSFDTGCFALGVFCVETEKKKIALIGPVYPYKGGIAHYTSLLHKALSKKYDVTMISYKMQYPKLLFKREQKDYSNDMFKVNGTLFMLNTANPFNIIKTGMYIRKINAKAAIIQWWHPYFAPCYRILESVLGKKTKKIFICHNVFPHERFPMDRLFTRLVLKKGDGFIVHSKSDGDDLLSIKPDALYRQNPHPTYNAFKIKNMTREDARNELGRTNDEKLLLFFGFVREYKGLRHLLDAMKIIKDRLKNVHLIIAGAFGDDKESYMKLIKDNGIEGITEVSDGYTPDSEVEKYFSACDIVALPYESATQSGIVQIAYGFGKPVLVTNVGGLPDVVTDRKTGYVVEPKSPQAIAEAVEDFFANGRSREFEEHIREEAYRFSWERLSEKIGEILKT